RYFSQGLPTKLVRDGERESYDLPPDEPPPEADLVPAGQPGGKAADGSDLLRADQAGHRYDPDKALNEAFRMGWLRGHRALRRGLRRRRCRRCHGWLSGIPSTVMCTPECSPAAAM